jgi:hypothetical protein
MKKIIYLFALAVLITACSKDDATPNYIDNNLIGTWELEYYYRDDDNNPINIDRYTDYEYFDAILHTITFEKDTTCGLILRYYENNEYYSTWSYYVVNNNIYQPKVCNGWLPIHPPYYLEWNFGLDGLKYKISNNKLIIAANSAYYTGLPFPEDYHLCGFYGFYKRKE